MKDICTGIFNDSYIPIMDGVSLTVRNYAFWLNRILGPTYVVTPSFPNYVDRDPFPVIRYFSFPLLARPPYRLGIPDLDPGLKSLLEKRDFRIIHTHSPFNAGKIALKIAREKGIPLVATFHSKYRDDLIRALPIKRIVDDEIKRIVEFFSSAYQVWVPQESVAKTLREYGYTGPYKVVENGIDLHVPASIEPYRKAGEKELNLDERYVMGLYVGQHVLEKNLEFLLRSVAVICRAEPNFRMVFVGQGYAKQHLRQVAAELGLGASVIFHDVIHSRELIKAIYARSDIFLFPSLYDNAPLVVREAAAFRTPAVLIKGSTAAEVIKDGENGVLVENNMDAFVEKVIALIRDVHYRERTGIGASISLCRTWEDVVREVKERYLTILREWAP